MNLISKFYLFLGRLYKTIQEFNGDGWNRNVIV